MDPSQVGVDALLEQRGWVRGLARTLCFDEHRADDVEQDAWLAALRRPPREGGSLRAWFASVVRSRVRDRHRTDVHRVEREAAAARPEATPSAADVASATETHRRLALAVLALDEPYRSAVILRYFEDLPPREIAARTGVPVETARTRVKRGIERLRERLDAEHHGDRRAWSVLVAPLAAGRTSRWTFGGGAIVAKKSAVLAALLLLALGAGVGVWFVSRPDATLPVVADGAVAERPSVSATRPPRSGREQMKETPAPPVAPATEVAEPKPDRPVVKVVDAVTGKPVAGAQIAVAGADGTTMWFNAPRGDGRFALDPKFTGSTVTVWAFAPGYARRRIADTALAADLMPIALQPAEPLHLAFVTEAGRTLDAAQVRALFGGDVPSATFEIVADDAINGGDVLRGFRRLYGAAGDWHTAIAIDGDRSSMRLSEGVSSGRWRLFVRRAGATPWLSEPFAVDGGSAVTVTVPVPETSRTRRVRLVAEDTKEPLANATLVPWYEYGDDQAFLSGVNVSADAEGVAELPYDPPPVRGANRPTTWWIHAPGRLGMFSAGTFDALDAADPLDVAVPRPVSVEGEAYLRSGEPAAGLRVITAAKGMAFGAVVGADGRFRMTNVPALDGRVAVMLLAGETFTGASGPVGADGVAHVVIGTKATPGTRGRISGVVTTGGVPVVGAFVIDQPKDAKAGFVRTDSDGRFVLDGIDVALEHDLCIYAGDPRVSEDYSRIRTTAPLVIEATKPLEFTFDLPAGALRVRVVDADTGRPVAAARVVGGPADGSSEKNRFAGFEYRVGWAGFTGDDGTLLLRAMLPGASHKVRVTADGYAAAEREGVVPGSLASPVELEIRLARK